MLTSWVPQGQMAADLSLITLTVLRPLALASWITCCSSTYTASMTAHRRECDMYFCIQPAVLLGIKVQQGPGQVRKTSGCVSCMLCMFEPIPMPALVRPKSGQRVASSHLEHSTRTVPHVHCKHCVHA